MRLAGSEHLSRTFNSDFDASQSMFDGSAQHSSAAGFAVEKADLARQRLKHLGSELQPQNKLGQPKSASSSESEGMGTSHLLEMILVEEVLEEEGEVGCAGSEEAEEESASEFELHGGINEDEEEEYADCCGQRSSAKCSTGSEANITRYMLADIDEVDSDDSASDSDSEDDDEEEEDDDGDDDDDDDGAVSGTECAVEYEHEQDSESHSGSLEEAFETLEIVERSPARCKSRRVHSECLCPMVSRGGIV